MLGNEKRFDFPLIFPNSEVKHTLLNPGGPSTLQAMQRSSKWKRGKKVPKAWVGIHRLPPAVALQAWVPHFHAKAQAMGGKNIFRGSQRDISEVVPLHGPEKGGEQWHSYCCLSSLGTRGENPIPLEVMAARGLSGWVWGSLYSKTSPLFSGLPEDHVRPPLGSQQGFLPGIPCPLPPQHSWVSPMPWGANSRLSRPYWVPFTSLKHKARQKKI